MKNLSKEEIESLPAELQEAYGALEFQRNEKLRALWATARRPRLLWYLWLPGVFWIAATLLVLKDHREIMVPMAVLIFGPLWVIGVRLSLLERRIDALVELMKAHSEKGSATTPQDPQTE